MVGSVKPGSKVKVEVWRNRATKEVTLTLGEWEAEVAAADEGEKAEKSAKTNRLGLSLAELSPQQKARLKLSGGLLVQAVSGNAERAGVQPGDVVLALNNDKVSSVDQFTKLLKQNEGAKSVALLIQRGDRTLFVPVKLS
jgi:serine protease Do